MREGERESQREHEGTGNRERERIERESRDRGCAVTRKTKERESTGGSDCAEFKRDCVENLKSRKKRIRK